MKKPFYSIGEFFQKKFNRRVQKLPLTISNVCPHQGCVFCDEWRGAAYEKDHTLSVGEQIRKHRSSLEEKYPSSAFLAYFQSHTSTLLPAEKLRISFDEALKQDKIIGIVIATRPDTMTQEILRVLEEYSRQTFVGVELGAQCFQQKHIDFLNRRHTVEQSVNCAKTIRTVGLTLGIHLIFGLPNEKDEEIIEDAQFCNSLDIQSVKIHNLHVLKNTVLAKLYQQKSFMPIDLAEYASKVILFLRHLDHNISVDRIAAVSARWENLVAPQWNRHKLKISQYVIDEMNRRSVHQSDMFSFASSQSPGK